MPTIIFPKDLLDFTDETIYLSADKYTLTEFAYKNSITIVKIETIKPFVGVYYDRFDKDKLEWVKEHGYDDIVTRLYLSTGDIIEYIILDGDDDIFIDGDGSVLTI